MHAGTSSGEEWAFHIAPYIWLAGMEGEVATLPGLPAADLDLDFWDDILEDLDGAIMLVGEARKGRHGIFVDFEYIDIESEDPTPKGALFSSIVVKTESLLLTAAGLYRFWEEEGSFLDVLVGLRYWSVDTDLSLKAGLLPAREASNKEEWLDPFFGFKSLSPLGKSPFFISIHLLIGGFNVGSDLMWDANINLGYQWTDGFATTLGYRYLDVDYEDDGFLYDIAQDGTIIGLSWRF